MQLLVRVWIWSFLDISLVFVLFSLLWEGGSFRYHQKGELDLWVR